MGLQFNFYQWDGTGTINPISYGFTGVYFPSQLIDGSNVGFVWRIVDDDIYYPTYYLTKLTGQQSKSNNEVFNINLGFSGNVFPVSQDSGNLIINLSGKTTGDYIDQVSFNPNLSGNVTGDKIDNPTFTLNIYGDFTPDNIDSSNFISSFTGNINQLLTDIPTLSVKLSGQMIPTNSDINSIDYNLILISYDLGGRHISIISGDNYSIDMIPINIIYR